MVPSTSAEHSCLLALVTCDEEPLDGSGLFDVDSLVRAKKQIALKNVHVLTRHRRAVDDVIITDLNSMEHMSSLYDLGIDWGLPSDSIILIAFEKIFDGRTVVQTKPDELKKLGIKVGKDKQKYFKEKIEYKCGEIKYLDLTHIYEITHSNDKMSKIPLIYIPKGKPVTMASNIILSKELDIETQFSVFQIVDNRIIGGNTYLLRPNIQNKLISKN